jgi:hypothetical protein
MVGMRYLYLSISLKLISRSELIKFITECSSPSCQKSNQKNQNTQFNFQPLMPVQHSGISPFLWPTTRLPMTYPHISTSPQRKKGYLLKIPVTNIILNFLMSLGFLRGADPPTGICNGVLNFP